MTTATIVNEAPEVVEVEEVVVKPARKLEPSLSRNLKIIGGVVVALVVVMIGCLVLFSGSSNKGNQAVVKSSLSQGTLPLGNDKEQLSPKMHDDLVQKQLDDQKLAAANGDAVFIPKDTLAGTVSLTQPKPPGVESQPGTGQNAVLLQGNGINQGQVQTQAVVEVSERDRIRREGMKIQLGELLKQDADSRGTGTPQHVVFQNPGSTVAAGTAGTAAGPSAAAAPKVILIKGLSIAAAETSSPVDTYKTKFASATIVAGPLKDAYLTGTATLVEEGLSTQYTRIRIGDKSCTIDAIALDEKTSSDAMDAANIDHRYLQRYVMPVAGAAIGGAATAMAATGSTVVATTGGVLGSVPAATGQQAAYAGLAAGSNIIQGQIAREAAKPYQATLAAQTPIGILFRNAVDAASCQ